MSPSKFIKNLIILCVLNFCFLLSFSYKEESLSNDEVCSHVKKRKLLLKKDSNSGKIIRDTGTFYHWSGAKEFICRYEVKSSTGDGVVAVIQNLVFRRDEDGDCIDYVKFIAKNGDESEKFCGRITAFKRLPIDVSADYSFVDPKGEMDTYIFVDNQKLSENEILDLEIVYTSYRECTHGRISYKSCGPFANNVCIWNEFFGDSYVNCPVGCYDEETCHKAQGNTVSASNVGTKVTVGAVATIILAFILFITCLWIMRRHRKLCWSDDCRGPRPSPPPTRVEMHPHLQDEDSASQPAPSAPTSHESAPVTISEDKDLPPSYESLFPAR